jgi:plastocyanin
MEAAALPFKTRTSVLLLSLLVVGALTVTACSGGGGAAALITPPPDAAASIDANNLKFSATELAVPAGSPFKLFFRDLGGVPHNVAIYRDSSASDKLFTGETITNAAAVYEVPAIPAGEYFFRCDVHPDMNGKVRAG